MTEEPVKKTLDEEVRAFRELAKGLSNWGRWGADDERGTVNFITPEVVKKAATLVRKGKVISMAIPFGSDGPQIGTGGRINPVHLMTATGGDSHTQNFPGGLKYTDDFIIMPLQSATQWDALAHVYYGDQIYNGYPSNTVTGQGAAKNSIERQRSGIVSRGILLDIARLKGVDWLGGGELISPADLDAAAAKEGVKVQAGDVVLIRTGWYRKLQTDHDKVAFSSTEPGLSLACAKWMHAHSIAAVAMDNYAVDPLPAEKQILLPFHMVAIRDMGMTLGEIFDMEELAVDCAADGVYEFLFVGAPLPIANGVGSPINPLAIK